MQMTRPSILKYITAKSIYGSTILLPAAIFVQREIQWLFDFRGTIVISGQRMKIKVLKENGLVPAKGDYRITFRAVHGKDYRFTDLQKTPATDISGRWETTFGVDTDNPYKAVGIFEQQNNHLTGTFQTETGDYRYLEGTVQGNKFYLSCFDGAHAFLFEGKIQEDNTLLGAFLSGKHYKTLWQATRNEDYVLTNPDSLTFLNPGYTHFDFAFENVEGKTISLSDPQFDNKIKLVQIMGTWCPNCLDETRFLQEYMQNNKNPDITWISLAFERYRDKAKAIAVLQNYKKSLLLDHEILLAGYANKKEAAEVLPMLNHVLSYPTLIFIDKNNTVRRIHTGFSGPATQDYADFVKEFDTFVRQLLEEE